MPRKRETSGKIRVRVLGGVEFQIGSRRVGMNTEVLFGLGLYLTMRAGERIPREEILETFWAKGTDAQRRHALRQMLYRLRQKGLVLDEDGDHVRLDPKRVDSDARAALGDSWVEKATAAEIEAAGRWGPVFSRRHAPGFLEWTDSLRDQVSAQHRKASLRQITVARREGRWADLERWAQQVLRSDPLNEEATLARAESAAMAGSKTIAIEILDNYLAEVGEISPELGKPALALRKRLSERRADWAVRGPKEVPLVGRTELMSRLTGLVEAAWRGEGSAVVLVGAPGIGKTRLAMETRAYAELKGMRTVVVRAEAGERERPLATILSLVSQLVMLPGARGSNPTAYALLERLSETAERAGALRSIYPDSSGDELISAVVEVLDAISTESRLLVILDDAHNIDSRSAPAISRIASQTTHRRIIWLATCRGNLESPIVRELVGASFVAQRVLPLDRGATEALVESVLAAHRLELSASEIESIASVSSGNPLFARELGAHHATVGTSSEIPQTLRDLMSTRTGRLDATSLRLIRVIALLDSCATVRRVRELLDLAPQQFSKEIDALESDGLIALEGGRLVLHESWRQHIQSELGHASRAALALECAECVLANEALTIEEKWRVAELLFEAGDRPRAKDMFHESGGEMLARGFPNEAAMIYGRVLELSTGESERMSAVRHLAEAHHARGDLSSVRSVTEPLSQQLKQRVLSQAEIDDYTIAICHRADALAKSHLPLTDELAWLLQACERSDLAVETRHFAAYTGIRRAIFAEDRELARAFHRIAQRVSAETGETVAGALVRLVYEAEFGSAEGVLAANDAVAALAESYGSITLGCNALRFRAAAVRMAGYTELSSTLGAQAFERAASHRQYEIAANAAEMMTFLSLDAEDLDSASTWLDRWRKHGRPEANLMRDQGFAHAEARLAIQQQDYDGARRLMEARLDEVSKDKVLSRRLGELGTYALAAVLSGKKRMANAIIEEIEPEILGAAPEFLLDYPNEVFARTLRAIQCPDRADHHSLQYMRKRSDVFPRPLARFYRELSSVQNLST